MASVIQKRSAAESNGNHCSHDVLAANIAKSIVLGSNLVTPDFVAEKARNIHPDDLKLFRSRIEGYVTDLLACWEGSNYADVGNDVIDGEIHDFLSGVTVSESAEPGAFISPFDCPDDRGRWFGDDDGRIFMSSFRNVAEDPMASPGVAVRELTDLQAARYLADDLFRTFGKDRVGSEELLSRNYRVRAVEKKDGRYYADMEVSGSVDFRDLDCQGLLGDLCVIIRDSIKNFDMARDYEKYEREMNEEALMSDSIRFENGPLVTVPGEGGRQVRLSAVYRTPDGVTRVQLADACYLPMYMFSDKSVSVIARACREKMDLILNFERKKVRTKARKNGLSL